MSNFTLHTHHVYIHAPVNKFSFRKSKRPQMERKLWNIIIEIHLFVIVIRFVVSNLFFHSVFVIV